MNYVRLGNAGLRVSPICLGCMSYGDVGRLTHGWVLDEKASRPFYVRALEAGINFFDTANMYSYGTSEEFLGRAMRELGAKREDLVIATKVYGAMRQTPNGGGLSRKAILFECDESLRRLRMDYIDLYQIHRYDHETPIEETLEALNDLVRVGKVRYLGASSMHAYQFARTLQLQARYGWARFISMQPHYNLIYREEEREMLRLCAEERIGVIPWSPLARGTLARPAGAHVETKRKTTDLVQNKLYSATEAADREVVAVVERVAKARGVTMAQVALAWIRSRSSIVAPIVGATKMEHLEDAIASLTLVLTDEERKALEAPYVPHAVAGF
jgi:aryl-alcohol dehydrogenase-like predicted oxidoreductase